VYRRSVHILVATDARYVADDVIAALGGPEVSFTVVREGRSVSAAVERELPDLAVLDLQIGSMGGMAVTMGLRLDESVGRIPRIPVLMLLDRQADIHLAKRCDANAWLVKPTDALTIKRAAAKILAEATAPPAGPVAAMPEAAPAEAEESHEEQPAAAG
jgi:CheY-like chemotaxis protein